jgi:hypothetical protein
MKKLIVLAASSVVMLLSSCYYDPNVSSSFGYSSYGGGGGGYSSSVFVSTGDDRWAYDPYRYSYYDRYRRSYYDPYLNGYYPTGYVPIAVRGCPHPNGWSGRGYCPPPRNISTRNLGRNDDRVSRYAAANYNWSRQVSGSGSSRMLGDRESNDLYSRSREIQREAPQRQNNSFMRGFGPSAAPSIRQEQRSQFDNNRGSMRNRGIRNLQSRESQPTQQFFRQESRQESTQRSEAPTMMRRLMREERSAEIPSPPIERPQIQVERATRKAVENATEEVRENTGGGLRRLQRSN